MDQLVYKGQRVARLTGSALNICSPGTLRPKYSLLGQMMKYPPATPNEQTSMLATASLTESSLCLTPRVRLSHRLLQIVAILE